jgi:hypothetical protein
MKVIDLVCKKKWIVRAADGEVKRRCVRETGEGTMDMNIYYMHISMDGTNVTCSRIIVAQ